MAIGEAFSTMKLMYSSTIFSALLVSVVPVDGWNSSQLVVRSRSVFDDQVVLMEM